MYYLGIRCLDPEAATFRDAVKGPMQTYLNKELDPAFVKAVCGG